MIQSPPRYAERPTERSASATPGDGRDRRPGVLVVDDDSRLDGGYANALEGGGYAVLRPGAGVREVPWVLDGHRVDLAVVGIGLAGIDGFELCRRCSEHGIPVIALSSSGTMAERVAAFEAGADDYIIRPVSAVDVLCRVRAVLRRVLGPGPAVVLEGPAGVTLDARSREVHVHDVAVEVTPRGFELLRLLLEHRGEVMTADAIATPLWGYETLGERNFVESQISRLRRRLSVAGATDVISTVRGVGYVIR